jgi:ribosomal protein S6--L-glutamate ligase
MRLGILSRKQSLYSTVRLKQAAEDQGFEAEIVDYLRCYMNVTSRNPKIIYKGTNLKYDAIIPRIGAKHTFYGTAVVLQFEMMGVFSVNGSQAITRSRNKLRTLQILAREGVGLPTTSFAHSSKDIKGIINEVNGAPLVVKLLEGTQGTGVVLAETKKAAESLIAAFRELKANILIQDYIQESEGSDIRAFVVGGKVVASMRRRAAPGDFRSNLHKGGIAEKVKLNPDERKIALKSAKVVGLNVAGVDIIRSDHGPLVLEINSSPGLEGIEKISGKDVAGEIIQFINKNVEKRKNRKVKDV